MGKPGRPRGGSGEWEQPFWQQRGWIVSAGFLLALALLAGVVLLARGDGEPAAASAPAPSAPATAAASGDGRPAGCRTDDGEQRKPERSPKDLYWKANGSNLVPVSKGSGPLKFDGSVWYCFARTPTGAVFAAHAIADHFGYAGWREVVERQVVPGPGRDAYVAARKKAKDKSPSDAAAGAAYAGFSVLSYNRREATVMLLVGAPGGDRYGSLSVALRWQDGDWKVVPDEDGAVYGGGAAVDGTDGFVTWGA
ncbi:hypothetical protein ACSMX9_17875 [Streptomyces sp. LE64]|uniref:hypothetical protein n=1 Tax=Streptomyces sp. LE64 TaxID=3448653 RepID=UPI00404318E4